MKSQELKKFLKKEYSEQDIFKSLIIEQTEEKDNQQKDSDLEDCKPSDIQLDKIITISQQLQDNSVKSFDFEVVEVWLKPNNMYTIVNVKKEKVQKNFWILFYIDGCYYLKKGVKGPIGVHCNLKETQQEE